MFETQDDRHKGNIPGTITLLSVCTGFGFLVHSTLNREHPEANDFFNEVNTAHISTLNVGENIRAAGVRLGQCDRHAGQADIFLDFKTLENNGKESLPVAIELLTHDNLNIRHRALQHVIKYDDEVSAQAVFSAMTVEARRVFEYYNDPSTRDNNFIDICVDYLLNRGQQNTLVYMAQRAPVDEHFESCLWKVQEVLRSEQVDASPLSALNGYRWKVDLEAYRALHQLAERTRTAQGPTTAPQALLEDLDSSKERRDQAVDAINEFLVQEIESLGDPNLSNLLALTITGYVKLSAPEQSCLSKLEACGSAALSVTLQVASDVSLPLSARRIAMRHISYFGTTQEGESVYSMMQAESEQKSPDPHLIREFGDFLGRINHNEGVKFVAEQVARRNPMFFDAFDSIAERCLNQGPAACLWKWAYLDEAIRVYHDSENPTLTAIAETYSGLFQLTPKEEVYYKRLGL